MLSQRLQSGVSYYPVCFALDATTKMLNKAQAMAVFLPCKTLVVSNLSPKDETLSLQGVMDFPL